MNITALLLKVAKLKVVSGSHFQRCTCGSQVCTPLAVHSPSLHPHKGPAIYIPAAPREHGAPAQSKTRAARGPCTHKPQPALSWDRIVGLRQQVDIWAPSRSADARKCALALWWKCRNVSKNAFMDCYVCMCLSSETPQGFTGQVANVRNGAWEFPSTKAVLPLFVTPQRTSGSITRDP